MSEKKKIVVADDEPFILSALQDTLSDDYTVFTASNGRLAIAEVEKVNPDMIILDVMMPEMDGLEACKNLKRNKETSAVPVILLTAKGQITDIEKGFKSGADAYVVKPFSPARLIEKVEEIFEKVEMRKKIIEDKKENIIKISAEESLAQQDKLIKRAFFEREKPFILHIGVKYFTK